MKRSEGYVVEEKYSPKDITTYSSKYTNCLLVDILKTLEEISEKLNNL